MLTNFKHLESDEHNHAAISLDLHRLSVLLKQQLWVVALATVIGALAGIGYILAVIPVYTSTASILIDSRVVQPLQDAGVINVIDAAAIESMAEIIKSRKVAASVVDDLSLSSSPLFFSDASSRLIPVRILTSYLQDRFGSSDEQLPPSDDEARQIAIQQVIRNVDVERVPRTNVFEISYTSTDPEMAAHVANAFVAAFKANQMSARTEAAQGATEWFQKQLEELRKKSAEADRQLQRLRSGDAASTERDRLTELRELEQKAETYRSLHQQFLQRLERAMQQETFPVSDIRTITPAWVTVPPMPSHPLKPLVLVLSTALGAMAGAGVAATRMLLSRTEG